MRYHETRASALSAMRSSSSLYVVPKAAHGLDQVPGWHWITPAKMDGRDVILFVHAARMREDVAYLDSL